MAKNLKYESRGFLKKYFNYQPRSLSIICFI